ncbi:Central kinetochore-associated [Penicillium robsamsonii]|uniref:Central kinetochore-associated n=1 Tax=Penicillium robsamsonii TaxID=1792511 RepID=UPI0025480060|nr:Central kinetochore-associated [Penicillium robsamsonii]KAJ5807487.1 Central kinetochore-associated [Penicillium robsamsonii]
MSNPLSPLSSSYQNARAQSQMANSSPFIHKTLDQPSEQVPSSPLKSGWTSHAAPSPNAHDENEIYHPNEPENENEHDSNDAESYQQGASSPFQLDGREDTVDFQKLREMRQTSSQSHPQLEPLKEESPVSSPFRSYATDGTVDFRGLREVQPMSPGLDKRLALGEPMSSPFRPNASEDTVDFQNMHEEQQSSPLPGPQVQPLEEESPGSSPFRSHIREETVGFQKLREVQPMSPGLGRRLALEEPASSPFRPDALEETVDFDRLREIQNDSPILKARPLPDPASSPFRYEARNATADPSELHEMQQDSPMASEFSSPVVTLDSPIPNAPETADSPKLHELKQDSPLASKRSSFAKESSLPIRDEAPEAVDPPKIHAHAESPVTSSSSSPIPVPTSSFRLSPKENALDLHKSRRVSRASLRLSDQRSVAATPRKRSYDQTPQNLEDDLEVNERHKKGMVSRPDAPAIHIDAEEEPGVLHDQSVLSATSVVHDRSAIGNSMIEDRHNEGMSTVLHGDGDKENISHENSMVDDSMDDTCLSTFSAMPDMTTFAKLRAQSPMKSMRGSVAPSPAPNMDGRRHSVDPATPGAGRRAHRASAYLDANSLMGSPTPRPRGPRDMAHPVDSAGLPDFTDQMNFFPRQSMQSARFSPSRRSPMRSARQSIRSPGKMSSLLDFDIPAAPTPRSIPTVTPRELESLKSGFLSDISSLKATLSGKEAEVASLKQAVADAERRVGEALEEVRNEAAGKEVLEMEQAEWERRVTEMETVLRSARSELVEGERERDRLSRKAEEAEKSKEKLEGKVVELESQLSAARAATVSSTSKASSSHQSSNSAEDTAREVQDAVEKVARELHVLYKGKHETKVAALKKSYESRWEKRLREAEKKLTAAREENEHLRVERDTAQSDLMAAPNTGLFTRENEEHEAERRVMEAQIQRLQREMAALKDDTERIRANLESERAEKGELVAAVDEWLAMQQAPVPSQPRDREPSVASSVHNDSIDEPAQPSREVTPDDFRRSVSRSVSGSIRPPATEKRIPKFGAPGGHSRGNSGGRSGIAMPTPGRGGIMSSIERMGRGGV